MQQSAGTGPGEGGHSFRGRRRYRSLFWALVLIGAGAVWLLYSVGLIDSSNLAVLGLVWPILLIGIGADLLVGRRSLGLGAVVGIITVAAIVVLMLIGPAAGWVGDESMTTETFSTPVGAATSAKVDLGLGPYEAQLQGLPASTAADRPLLRARVTYRGTVEFSAQGESEKTVILESGGNRRWWQWLDDTAAAPWDIGLDPGTPLDLTVEASSGSSRLDLTGLRVRAVSVDASSGDTLLILPSDPVGAYRPTVGLKASSGSLDLELPDGGAANVSVDTSSGDTQVSLGRDCSAAIDFRGSSGEFTVRMQPGQAFRVEVKDISSGSVKLPAGVVVVEGGEDGEGVWETPGYATAPFQTSIVIERMSSGNVYIVVGG